MGCPVVTGIIWVAHHEIPRFGVRVMIEMFRALTCDVTGVRAVGRGFTSPRRRRSAMSWSRWRMNGRVGPSSTGRRTPGRTSHPVGSLVSSRHANLGL